MTAPMPSLDYYAHDAEAMIPVIERRGIHPDEVRAVVATMEGLLDALGTMPLQIEEMADKIGHLEEELATLRGAARRE